MGEVTLLKAPLLGGIPYRIAGIDGAVASILHSTTLPVASCLIPLPSAETISGLMLSGHSYLLTKGVICPVCSWLH